MSSDRLTQTNRINFYFVCVCDDEKKMPSLLTPLYSVRYRIFRDRSRWNENLTILSISILLIATSISFIRISSYAEDHKLLKTATVNEWLVKEKLTHNKISFLNTGWYKPGGQRPSNLSQSCIYETVT